MIFWKGLQTLNLEKIITCKIAVVRKKGDI